MKQRCSFAAVWLVLGAFLLGIVRTEGLKHNYYTKHDERSLIGPLGFPFGFLDTGSFNLTVFDFHLEPTNKQHKHDPHQHRSLAAKKNKGGENDNNPCLSSGLCLNDVLEKVKGVGFLLKRFDDEAHFNRYMATVEADGTCIFQKFLDRKQDEGGDDFPPGFDDMYLDDQFAFTYGDDGVACLDGYEYDDYYGCYDGSRRQGRMKRRELVGSGEITNNVPEDGIYIDMKDTRHWRPNHAFASYDFEEGEAGFYFLIYQVCYKTDGEMKAEGLDETKPLFDVHTRFALDFHFSNIDRFGHVSYLSRGEMNLPWMYLAFSMMYAVCLWVWHFNIKLIKDGKQGYFDVGEEVAPPAIPGGAAPSTPTIYPIHYLMGVLLTLKFCSLLFEAVRFHYLRVLGHAVFFSAIYYVFAFLKGMTLFTVILLIGSGWSFVKPFLSDREKNMILGVLVLQVINNIALVALTTETEGERAFDNWTAILHLVDIICCCAVLMPIIWQVNQLEQNMEQDQHKGKEEGASEEDSFINDRFADADEFIPEDEFEDESEDNAVEPIPDARMAAKLKLFRSFYMIVIAYIYMTRIVVYLFDSTLDYKHTWVTEFVIELTTLVFYCSVGYMFRPMNENPYLHIGIRKKKPKRSQVEMRKIDPSTKTALD